MGRGPYRIVQRCPERTVKAAYRTPRARDINLTIWSGSNNRTVTVLGISNGIFRFIVECHSIVIVSYPIFVAIFSQWRPTPKEQWTIQIKNRSAIMRRRPFATVLVGHSALLREGLARILNAADFRIIG